MAVSAEALHNVTTVLTGLNGRTPAENDVRETIGLVRTRLRTAATLFSVKADANTMAWALQPIAALVFDALADGTLDDEEVSLAIWNAYVGAVAKTKGADKFQTITADGGNWADTCWPSCAHMKVRQIQQLLNSLAGERWLFSQALRHYCR